MFLRGVLANLDGRMKWTREPVEDSRSSSVRRPISGPAGRTGPLRPGLSQR
ncbi:hypothetical protein I552_6624 [Mycobacterium xenopi 3993]|nr:hypothetical protein I552_6624 [Mycobacterium xenopi 3993]